MEYGEGSCVALCSVVVTVVTVVCRINILLIDQFF